MSDSNPRPTSSRRIEGSSSAGELIFENPSNDFPKRVIYRKVDDTALTARIDNGEGVRTIEFPYRRCAAGPRDGIE